MFESDDFDQILSQFDFDVIPSNDRHVSRKTSKLNTNYSEEITVSNEAKQSLPSVEQHEETIEFPKQTKRKMIDSLFDPQSKRKFPGPAGLLTGTIEDNNSSFCQIELLSQDVDFSENHIDSQIFDSALWKRLKSDMEVMNLGRVDSIKTIKQQALAGNLRRRKADVIIAFVEAVDRSAPDPLLILRDVTGNIKCTLHRDAWSVFSAYIVSEYCAIALWKPTVLTTGSSYKKHYLNITLSNIVAVYSSAMFTDEAETKPLPDGYSKECGEDFTAIRTDNHTDHNNISNNNDSSATEELFLATLDSSIFLDDFL